ncbi:lipoprotein LpqH [Mycobacterium intracellulare]|uniref:lipoprotein LpqH n=1 Tax=Mycobacterium intracellulare TaxID=1767 RepID=UPI002F264F62
MQAPLLVERFITGGPRGGYISLAEGWAEVTRRNRGGLVQKRFFNTTAAALVASGIAACSSAPLASPPSDALAAGTARVTINDKELPATTSVKCSPIGALTTITTGDTAAGVTALISNETGLTAKSVSITNLGGFTGSYMKGLDGNAGVSMTGQTYMIRGTADGFDTDHPSVRTTGTFAIRVAC